MGRAPCCDKDGLKKGPWTAEEDKKLIDYIQMHGHGSWRTLPKNAGLARCGKSCRLRWTNYLRPDIKRGRFSFEEEETIIQLHGFLGNKWSAIAARLPGRTDNEIKNYWNTHIRKRLLRMGIDPVTHSPRLDFLELSPLLNPSLCNTAQLDVSRLMGIEPLVNAEILRLATNLLTGQLQSDQNFLNQNPQDVNFSSPQIQGTFPTFQPRPLQRAVQDMAACTTASVQFLGEQPQAMQTNVELFQPDVLANNRWQASEPLCSITETYASSVPANACYQPHSQQVMPLPRVVPKDTNFETASHDRQEFDPSPVLSTSASTPTRLNYPSSSPYINSSGIEDERGSYGSDLFDFRVPNLLDVGELI